MKTQKTPRNLKIQSMILVALTITSSLIFSSCLKNPNPLPAKDLQNNPPVVFTAGFETNNSSPVATYWINDSQSPFTDGAVTLPLSNSTYTSVATGIVANATDVYVSGYETEPTASQTGSSNMPLHAVYWKNTTQTILPGNGPGMATSITLDGTDIYVAGSDNYEAVYWKNSIEMPLPNDGKKGVATAIIKNGSDIYITGYLREVVQQTPQTSMTKSTAVFWKNGTLNILDNSSDNTIASAIAISGTDVYIAGTKTTNAIYWKNGIEYSLSNSGDTRATGIAINGSDIYISAIHNSSGLLNMTAPNFAMTSGSEAIYWKNNNLNYIVAPLPPMSGFTPVQTAATGIAVAADGTTFISGNKATMAHYWKDGNSNTMQLSATTPSIANAIFIQY